MANSVLKVQVEHSNVSQALTAQDQESGILNILLQRLDTNLLALKPQVRLILQPLTLLRKVLPGHQLSALPPSVQVAHLEISTAQLECMLQIMGYTILIILSAKFVVLVNGPKKVLQYVLHVKLVYTWTIMGLTPIFTTMKVAVFYVL